MQFRSYTFGSWDKDAALPETLPEPRRFELQSEALQHYQPLLQKVDQVSKPWLSVADGIRLVSHLTAQFRRDWPLIRASFSEDECRHLLDAYVNLSGLLQAWQYVDGVLEGLEGEDEGNNLLQKALLLRNELLALAGVAFRDKPALLEKIALVRSKSSPDVSFYDEASNDLASTITLFEDNRFTTLHYVNYPETMLKEASTLSSQLPLFRPTPSTDPQQPLPPPLLHRTFTLFAAAYYWLTAAGRYLLFSEPPALQLYPKLAYQSLRSKDSDT